MIFKIFGYYLYPFDHQLNNLRILLLLIISLLIHSISTFGQNFDEKDFSLFTSKDGLSDNRITSIAQDNYGYIWISTQKGLNRFDGNNFAQLFSDSSRNSLPQDYIKQLKWVNKSWLGASTAAGLHLINPSTLEERNIVVPPGPLQFQYKESNVWGMAGDENGNVFLLTATGFYHFDKDDNLLFRYDHYKKDQLDQSERPFGRSDGLIMPEPGVLLLATTNGVYIYKVASREFRIVNTQDKSIYQQISQDSIWVHFMHSDDKSFSVQREDTRELSYHNLDRNKKYLLHTSFPNLHQVINYRSKITRLNDSTWIIISMQKGFYLINYDKNRDEFSISPKNYLNNYRCTSIFLDRSNRLWIGTDKGLLCQNKNAGSVEKVTIPASMNPDSRSLTIRMMTVTRDKLFVTSIGMGVMVFDRRTLQPIKRFDFAHMGPGINDVVNILKISNDSVYAGTYGPLIGIDANRLTYKVVELPDFHPDHEWIASQYKDSKGNLYIGINKNSIYYYRPIGQSSFQISNHDKNPLFNILTPMHIAEDRQGNIWFSGHGISRLNTRTHSFDQLIDSFPRIKVPRKEATALVFDNNGIMYFGLPESGLIIYDPRSSKFTHLTRNNGLPDNWIRANYFHNGKIWIGTESGLANYDIASGIISSFGLSDDMPEGPFTGYAFYYDSINSQLYGSFNNTVVRFNPDSLLKNNSPPDFFIEKILVSGDQTIYHPKDKINLSYKHNNIVLQLASINFEDAYQQQFAYRFLDKGDEPWQLTGTQQDLLFSNLSPGKHRLQVKVFVKNNSWPEQMREIEIYVAPPFWQKPWFIMLATVLILSLLYFIYRRRINSVRQKAGIDRQMAELEIKGLHAQMNPHFIFNCLNSIKEMILEDEKQNASRYLSKFAQLIRTNLEQSKQTFISVNQCIEHLQQYLEMEKIRLGSFNYSIHVDKELSSDYVLMPPMVVQPLVENAIWHGLHPLKGDKQLEIRFQLQENKLICEIEDNGIGIVRSRQNKSGLEQTHKSFGIANVKDRLNVLNEKYKMNCSLTIIDKESMPGNNGSGTLVRLELTTLNHEA